eukprot:TRINITY_DN27288_c0_g3_i1.p1 TRINITY_DN27288_c0_g3~~TRINITY_DN27288_c0_g3_i1.p1  ORF type:complete len:1706 (-),score=251.67 TRINITY_DN27288_c0_g3_i1:46-5163(-)
MMMLSMPRPPAPVTVRRQASCPVGSAGPSSAIPVPIVSPTVLSSGMVSPAVVTPISPPLLPPPPPFAAPSAASPSSGPFQPQHLVISSRGVYSSGTASPSVGGADGITIGGLRGGGIGAPCAGMLDCASFPSAIAGVVVPGIGCVPSYTYSVGGGTASGGVHGCGSTVASDSVGCAGSDASPSGVIVRTTGKVVYTSDSIAELAASATASARATTAAGAVTVAGQPVVIPAAVRGPSPGGPEDDGCWKESSEKEFSNPSKLVDRAEIELRPPARMSSGGALTGDIGSSVSQRSLGAGVARCALCQALLRFFGRNTAFARSGNLGGSGADTPSSQQLSRDAHKARRCSSPSQKSSNSGDIASFELASTRSELGGSLHGLVERALSFRLGDGDGAAVAASLCRFHTLHRQRYDLWLRCHGAIKRNAAAGVDRQSLDQVHRMCDTMSRLEVKINSAEQEYHDEIGAYLRRVQQEARDQTCEFLASKARMLVDSKQQEVDEIGANLRTQIEIRKRAITEAVNRVQESAREEFWRRHQKTSAHKLMSCVEKHRYMQTRRPGSFADNLKELVSADLAGRSLMHREAEAHVAARGDREQARRERDLDIWLSKMEQAHSLQHLQAAKDEERAYSRVDVTMRRLEQDQLVELRLCIAGIMRHTLHLQNILGRPSRLQNMRQRGSGAGKSDIGGTLPTADGLELEPFVYAVLRSELALAGHAEDDDDVASGCRDARLGAEDVGFAEASGSSPRQIGGHGGSCRGSVGAAPRMTMELCAFSEFLSARFPTLRAAISAMDITGSGRLACFELQTWLWGGTYPGEPRVLMKELDRRSRGCVGIDDFRSLAATFGLAGLRSGGRLPGTVAAAITSCFFYTAMARPSKTSVAPCEDDSAITAMGPGVRDTVPARFKARLSAEHLRSGEAYGIAVRCATSVLAFASTAVDKRLGGDASTGGTPEDGEVSMPPPPRMAPPVVGVAPPVVEAAQQLAEQDFSALGEVGWKSRNMICVKAEARQNRMRFSSPRGGSPLRQRDIGRSFSPSGRSAGARSTSRNGAERRISVGSPTQNRGLFFHSKNARPGGAPPPRCSPSGSPSTSLTSPGGSVCGSSLGVTLGGGAVGLRFGGGTSVRHTGGGSTAGDKSHGAAPPPSCTPGSETPQKASSVGPRSTASLSPWSRRGSLQYSSQHPSPAVQPRSPQPSKAAGLVPHDVPVAPTDPPPRDTCVAVGDGVSPCAAARSGDGCMQPTCSVPQSHPGPAARSSDGFASRRGTIGPELTSSLDYLSLSATAPLAPSPMAVSPNCSTPGSFRLSYASRWPWSPGGINRTMGPPTGHAIVVSPAAGQAGASSSSRYRSLSVGDEPKSPNTVLKDTRLLCSQIQQQRTGLPASPAPAVSRASSMPRSVGSPAGGVVRLISSGSAGGPPPPFMGAAAAVAAVAAGAAPQPRGGESGSARSGSNSVPYSMGVVFPRGAQPCNPAIVSIPMQGAGAPHCMQRCNSASSSVQVLTRQASGSPVVHARADVEPSAGQLSAPGSPPSFTSTSQVSIQLSSGPTAASSPACPVSTVCPNSSTSELEDCTSEAVTCGLPAVLAAAEARAAVAAAHAADDMRRRRQETAHPPAAGGDRPLACGVLQAERRNSPGRRYSAPAGGHGVTAVGTGFPAVIAVAAGNEAVVGNPMYVRSPSRTSNCTARAPAMTPSPPLANVSPQVNGAPVWMYR